MVANDFMNEVIYKDFCTSKQMLMQKQVDEVIQWAPMVTEFVF